MSDALADTNNKKNDFPFDQLWDMAEMNVVGTEDGTPNHYVRQFGRDRDGELYVLVNDKLLPRGETGKVLKIVPPEEGDQQVNVNATETPRQNETTTANQTTGNETS